jgi:molybdopterin-binding protein
LVFYLFLLRNLKYCHFLNFNLLLYLGINNQKTHKKMEISARNSLKGTVIKVVPGTVNTEITLEIAPGVELVSIITKSSAEKLGLVEGKQAYAVIKASDVIVAVD